MSDPAAAAFRDRASKLAALGMTGPIERLWRAQGMEDRDRAATPDGKAAHETATRSEPESRSVPESRPEREQPVAAPSAGDMDYPSSEGNGRLRVREYGPEDGGYTVEPRPDAIEQATRLRSAGDDGPVRLRAEDGAAASVVTAAGAAPSEDAGRTEQARPAVPGFKTVEGVPRVPGAEGVAARLLAEVLALDLGTMTPIRALTLLHELQTQAREAVPWSSWMASMAGAVPHVPPADEKTT
jgi:hypothetical protein